MRALALVLAFASAAWAGEYQQNRSSMRRRVEEREVRSIDRHRSTAAAVSYTQMYSLLPTDGTGAPTVPDLCDAASSASLLTGNWACLRADGTNHTGAVATFAAQNSPGTQTRAHCPNGLTCSNVTRRVLNGSNQWFKTGAGSTSGSFSACGIANFDSDTIANTYEGIISRWQTGAGASWYLTRQSGSQAEFAIYNGSAFKSNISAVGTLVPHMDQLWCGVFVSNGASSTVTLYLEGVQTGTPYTGADQPSSASQFMSVGNNNGGTYFMKGRVRGAFYTEKALSQSELTALASAMRGTFTSAAGGAVAWTRGSATSCPSDAAATTITMLPNNVPCITQGGARIHDSGANEVGRSDTPDNAGWTKVNATVTGADTLTAPDGSLSMETTTSTSSGGYIESGTFTLGSLGTANAFAAAWFTSASALLVLRDTTAGVDRCSVSGTGTMARRACTSTAVVQTNNHVVRFYPGGTGGTGSDTAWGFHAEGTAGAGVVAPYVRTSGASRVPRSADAVALTVSGFPTTQGQVTATVIPEWSASSAAQQTSRVLYCDGSGTGWQVRVSSSTGGLVFAPHTGTATGSALSWTSGSSYALSWAWQASNSTATFLRDGASAGSATYGTTPGSTGTTCYLGSNGGSSPFFHGVIGNLGVYQ